MPNGLTTLAFDADDTLWQNEEFFQLTQERFTQLLADFADPDDLAGRLLEAERRNLGHYGYGIKGFVLSMIETAIEITDQRLPASVIAEILQAGQDMLQHPIHLLPGVAETISALSPDFHILLITKGDLLDQERKLAQSGLGDLFDGVEILSEKTQTAYTDIFARFGDGPSASMMIGNSLKSDVIPALGAGAWGVHVPHSLTWAIEAAEPPKTHPRFREINELAALPDLISSI